MRTVLVLAVLLLAGAGAAWACPTCAAGMKGEDAERLLRGYLPTALFMFTMPFVVVGTIIWNLKKALAEGPTQAALSPGSGSATPRG